MSKVAVYLELGPKRVFAGSFDWPGWARFDKGFGRGEEAALQALAGYAERYAVVADEAGLRFPSRVDLQVVERVPGNATTDFGAPGGIPQRDRERVSRGQAERMVALVTAAWRLFDRGAAKAPAELRKGPRGGGRDRDKMIRHVVESEFGYARQIAVKRRPEPDDAAAVAALREEMVAVLGGPSDGGPLVPNGWPARYASRRIAWHVLDHLWEMEDRSE